MFLGEIVSTVEVSNKSGDSREIRRTTETMGPIVLDVSKKDIYASWNSAFRDTVEGYKYEAKSFYRSQSEAAIGLPKQCLNETWISQLPSSLFFS